MNLISSGPETVTAKGHERGSGFLPNSAIDQHVSKRHREHDREPVLAAHPKLFGIGIDPNTIIAITVTGHRQYSITSGGRFDLRKRKPL
jgi:cyanophycinase-like exopeptidase